MRAVIQRVSSATVTTGDRASSIETGLVVLLGVERGDGPQDVDYIAKKITELRLFSDGGTREFDRSVQDVKGRILVVSQFTLAADCRKGRRPSFDAAAPPEVARPLYESVVMALGDAGLTVETGVFQAHMQVALVNDGPVTVLLDSRRQF
jgi:D-tyrosyl-tRNA(Tyr) deacylase